jgi:hypothetical protein
MYRSIPPSKRIPYAPPTSTLLHTKKKASDQFHRIDISEKEYETSRNKRKHPGAEKRRSQDTNSEDLATGGLLNSRVDGEMFPSQAVPVKSRGGWKVVARAVDHTET